MPIRVDDPRPPYLQLAAQLRDAITAGNYEPGDKLPSTRRLAEENGISPMTVQHAMKVLRAEGLLVSHQGRGVYVQDREAATEAGPADTPKTLDEALAMLAEVQARLDRLEAGISRTDGEIELGPRTEPGPGIDV